MNNLSFYIFSLFSIIFSLAVVTSKNPVHSVLSLILVFFSLAGLFIILGAEFLAILFIIVYVGAVAVLFLFIIMMLNIKLVSLDLSMYRYIPLFFIFGSIFCVGFSLVVYDYLIPVNVFYIFNNYMNNWFISSISYTNVAVFSYYIYTYYSILFLVSGIILLVSMIGAISLTLHKRNDIKRQYIYKQINRNFQDSIRWRI